MCCIIVLCALTLPTKCLLSQAGTQLVPSRGRVVTMCCAGLGGREQAVLISSFARTQQWGT